MAETGKGVTAGKLAINVQKRLTRAQEKVGAVKFSFSQDTVSCCQCETQHLHFLPSNISNLPAGYGSLRQFDETIKVFNNFSAQYKLALKWGVSPVILRKQRNHNWICTSVQSWFLLFVVSYRKFYSCKLFLHGLRCLNVKVGRYNVRII